MSRFIQSGSGCKPSDLGKIAQQPIIDIKVLGGQLQCTYNPTFCANDGYCYLPVKSGSLNIQYRQNIRVGICPSGSRVHDQQPTDNIDRVNVMCPGSIIGERVECYRRRYTNITFCVGYQTVCTYIERGNYQRVVVPALKKLICTSATTEYTIDSYVTN